MPEQDGMYTCTECGEDFDSLTDDDECPHCGQEYVFPPVEEDDTEVLTPDGSSETHNTVEEAINAEGGSIGKEDEEDEKTQNDLGDVIVPSEEIEDNGPECEHCGEPMDEAPEQIDADWLCHNDGCEGSFTEEELQGEEDEEQKKQCVDCGNEYEEGTEKRCRSCRQDIEDQEQKQENLIYGSDGLNEDFEKDAG